MIVLSPNLATSNFLKINKKMKRTYGVIISFVIAFSASSLSYASTATSNPKPDFSSSTITVTPTTLTTDKTAVITVQLKDAERNPIKNGGDRIAIASSLIGTSLTEVVDNNNGTYTTTISSTSAGTANISFSINGSPASAKTALVFEAGAPSPFHSTISASPNTLTLDNSSKVTVQLVDAYGNQLTKGGARVVITSRLPGTILSPAIDNQNGTYTATLSSTTVGKTELNFSVNDVSASATAMVTFTVGVPDVKRSLVRLKQNNITTDESGLITIQLKDSGGNFLTTGGAKIGVTTDLAGVTISPVVDNKNGSYSIAFNSRTVGKANFALTINGVEVEEKKVVEFVAGNPSSQYSVMTIDKNSFGADSSAKVTVQLKDKFGNLLTTGGDNISILSDLADTKISNVIDHQDGSYSAELSSSSIGRTNISFTINHIESSTKLPVTITPGAASVSTSVMTIDKNELDVNSVATVSIQLKDAGNNLTNGVVAVISDSPDVKISNVTDLRNGTYTAKVNSSVVGSANLYFMINNIFANGQTRVTFKTGAANPSKSEIQVNKQVLGIDDVGIVTVKLKDIAGNPINVGGDKVNITSNSTNLTLTPVIDNGDGTYTAEFSSKVLGPVSFNFTVNEKPSQSKAQSIFEKGIVDLAASTIMVNSSTLSIDNEGLITIQLKDSAGNLLNKADAMIAVRTDLNGVSVSPVISNGNGSYTAKIKSNATGKATLGFSVDGKLSPVKTEVEFDKGLPNPVKSKITSNLNSLTTDQTATITVKLHDLANNPLDKATAKVVIISDLEGTSLTPVIDNNDGSYSAELSALSAGHATLRFMVNDVLSPEHVLVTFNQGKNNLK